MSTESLTSSSQRVGGTPHCSACGSPLAPDQRYCLQCGERTAPARSVLLGGPPAPVPPQAPAGPPPAPPAPAGPFEPIPRRDGTLAVIAGVGVLLLAMGVGVLIGRSGSGDGGRAGSPAITVAQAGGPATSTPASGEAEPGSDWPAGTRGYTVQLRTLPQSGTPASAVQAAKSEAAAKGAKAVGALRSEDFTSLPAGEYVIYSGVYHKRSEAQKALSGLRASFPAAKVIEVGSGSGGRPAAPSEGASGSGAKGSTPSNPAPPSVLAPPKSKNGKSFEEKSKNLPNVISTG